NRSGNFRRFYAFPATVGGRSATHSPLRRSATTGKAATATVVAAVVQGEGGKGGCEGGAVGEVRSPEKYCRKSRRKNIVEKVAGKDGGSPEKSAGKVFRRRRRAVAAAGNWRGGGEGIRVV
ncbi:hypothetical protein Tco_1566532, partial [Tanacetum coccineum]